MSKSSIAIVSLVVVSSLLLSACQTQSPAASTPQTGTTTVASSAPATLTNTAVTTTEGKKLADQETYQSPAGPEKVAFTLTVDQQGVITDAQTENMAVAPTSKMRQDSFAKELPKAIVGKKLANLTKIDRVGGSSLTTGAFNAALVKLKAQL